MEKIIEEMSNEIADMAINGASEDELKEAIKSSMETIDEMKEQDKVKRYSGRYPWGTK